MNSYTFKKIISILLSIMICVLNSVTPLYADEETPEFSSESETEVLDNSLVEETIEEQVIENEEVNDEIEQNNTALIADNENVVSTASEQEYLPETVAEGDTFADIQTLKTFYESNNEGVLQNALDFTNFSNNTIGANAIGLILLSCVEQESFEGYTIILNGLSGGGSNLATAITGFPYTFHGLGRSDYPFKGTITVSDATQVEYFDLIIDRPFFNSIDVTYAKVDEKIKTIKISTAADSAIAFAQEVVGNDELRSWENVKIEISEYTYTDNESQITTYPGSCIGVIKSSAYFSLGNVTYTSKVKINEPSGNAGLLCNVIEENASFSVGSISISNDVDVNISSGFSSGGLVGKMATNSSLNVGSANKLIIDKNWEIKGKDAGALIGSGNNVSLALNIEVNGAKITSDVTEGSAGGIFGYYNLASDAEGVFHNYSSEEGKIKVTNVTLDAIAERISCGALFGKLELSKDFQINGSTSETEVIVTSTAGLSMSGGNYVLNGSTYYGGLVGQVFSTDSNTLLPALRIDGDISVNSTVSGGVGYYGGLVGVLGKPGIDNAYTNGVYIVLNLNSQVSTNCINSEKLTSVGHYFGGAIGGMFYDSVLEIAEGSTFVPTATNIKYGGGIVGVAGRKSTLRLAGTTNLSNVTFSAASLGQNPASESNCRNTNGQIVGAQNASIIYAAKTWELTRPTNRGEIDDIGNYGSVIRLGKNIGQGSENLGTDGGLSESLISQNSDSHKTEFEDIAALPNDYGTVEISNADQFALLSIADQTYGDFDIYKQVKNGFIISDNKIKKIIFANDINLSNTGIIGFQRDFYNRDKAFIGALDGGGHKITLDIGQLFANNDSIEAGSGQIHGHPQIGLFSQANATIKNLTISGTINIRERTLTNSSATSMAVGAAVALSTGSESIFDNVTTEVTINCYGTGTGSAVGGLLGLKQGTDSSVSISNSTGKAKIIDNTATGAHVIGGLIGTNAGGGTITVNNSSIKGSIVKGSVVGNAITNAKYGGLISVIKDNATVMKLNNLTVDGQKITNNATATSGGLLGYEWDSTEAYFGDGNSTEVTITGESEVTVSGDASIGGLVYCATGYWQVNNLKLNKATIQNQNGDLGLLICYGRKDAQENTSQITQLLYVEETKYDGYHIDGANITLSSAGGFYDEWVVYTAKDASTIIDNGNSVISIATQEENGNRKGFDTTEDTSTGYQNKTTNKGIEWVANPNARYYYDLDFIREQASSTNGYVDTAGEVVLWSVWRYCEKVSDGKGIIVDSNIQNYLKTDDIISKNFDGNGAVIDLTGYSYYPVTIDGTSVDIKNCTIKFANQIINVAEEKSGTGLDSLNRNTTGTAQTHTQHYMMHTGLILNYLNTSKSVSSVALSVNNVQLKGTIGKSSDNYGSGAIVCGVVEGTNVGGNHFASVKLHTVTMDNLVVNTNMQNEEYAPLLINKVGSYGGINAQQISTNYYNSDKVATSLIGRVGNATATNISMAFSNVIELNGKTNESIFTHATLLESFEYLASSSGYYHFNESDKCTYGKEIEGTVEYVGQQLKYFDTRNIIKDGNNSNFNTSSYLPYVYKTKVTNPDIVGTFHELEINIVKPDLNEGCGTYDDPYIISQAEQLNLVAQYIAGITTANWKINIVDNAEIIKTENENNHTLYVFDDQKWKINDASDETLIKSESDVRNYLRNAYYKISNDLLLDNFSGLGTMESPFRGVVDGGDKQITVNAEKITSGFINVSYGSVVQNLNIVYTGTKTMSKTQAALNSNVVANESYFGGIIGDVKGGDNLINNVSVSFDDGFKIAVQNHLQCVGGFFGIVEGGGVILSNMNQPEGLKASNIDTSLTESNQAYISALVGRVLDGFVINKTETTTGTAFEAVDDNGDFISDKNYSIGNISSTASLTIDVRDGNVVNVELDNAEKLLLLSALINSGACNGGWSLAYKENYGKVRNADYSEIGNIDADNKEQYFNPSRNDDAKIPSAVNLPYLINKYAGKKSIFWNLCMVDSQYYLQLNIKNDLDMSHYKNGYRGIGGRYNCTATSEVEKTDSTIASQKTGQFQRNTPVFVGVDGGKNVLTVSNIIKGYSDDNYVVNAAGGLINVLRRKVNTEITIENLTVSGNVELHDFSDTSSADATNASGRAYAASVGGVIGRYFTEETGSSKTTYLKLNNLAANRLTLYSDGATGGIVGQTGTKSMYVFVSFSYQYASGVTYTDCSYSNLKAMSCQSTGGILGAACDNADSYYYNGVNNDKNVTSKMVASRENVKTGYNSALSVYASTVSGNGLGGLIGNVGSNVEINKDGTYPLVLDKITLQDSNATGVSRTGGVVGFLHHGITKAYNITVSNSALGNGKDDNLGGIVGCWFSSETGGVIDNIVIDKCTLTSYYSVGGLVGYIQGGIKDIRNITVNNTDISQITYNSSGRGVAMVVGEIVGGGIIGENILLKGNTISAQPNVLKGRIVGKTSDLPIQLLGVSISFGNDRNGNTIDVSSQPAEDIGSIKYTNYSNNASKIFISYDAFLTEATLGSGLAQYPYVSIPGVGIEETLEANTTYKITGDTVKPYTITGSDTVTGIVDKEGDNYTYIGVNKTYQYVATGAVNYLVPGIVSTYNANQDTSIPSDFDVIQIDGSAACLRQYLNAATNGAFATAVAVDSKEANSSKKIMTVDVSRYKWNLESNIFEKDSEAKPTLVYDSKDGSFYATAQYDNQNNMFTLVSVTFKTTANNYSRTYHIPVIVRRMLQVDFMATMVSGTVFNAAEMDEYKTHALASKGEEITGYLTFKYNSNLSGLPATYDWQGYMNGGANLLGYYQKTLDTGSELLPEGTQITLIDCQQSEKRYYAVVPEGGSCLELFSGSNLSFSHSDGTPYQPVSLAELLKISSDKIKNPDYSGVKWVSVDKSEATVVDTEGQYYRLYDDNKDGSLNVTDCFELSVTNNSPEENYFVVISVPNAENHMLTLIKTGGVTKGDMTWSNGKTNAPPTEIHQLHRYTDVADKYTSIDTNKSSEITFNFLDNYSQTLVDQLNIESIPVTSQGASFVEMEFEVKNTLTFNPANYEQSDPLYQELRVSLRKTTDNKGTDMYFPSDSKATVNLYAYYIKNDQKIYFEVDENGKLIEASNVDYDNPPAAVSYDWIAGNDGIMVLPFAVKNTNDTYQYVDLSPLREASRNEQIFYIEAKFQKPITIGINSVIANDILPVRESTESLNQTSFYITSLLSFKESGLSYSTLKKSVAGNKGYYLNEKREAVLKLDYLNIDQLGINLSDEYSGEIDTMLTLDLSGSEGFNTDLNKFLALKDSDSIEFQFSLKQKGESGLNSEDYDTVPIGDYIPQVYLTVPIGDHIPQVYLTNGSFILTIDKTDGTYPYYNENSGVFNIPVTFEVNTTDVQLYSNYRIYVTAKLKKGEQDQTFAINEEKAFITYTIAKININGIWSRPIENG